MGFGLSDAADLLNGGNPLENAMNDIPVPSIPSVPGISDFENFSTGTACIETAAKHTALTLKLNSSHLGGEVIVDTIKPMLEEMLCIEGSTFEIPDLKNFNMDLSISKIGSPKIGDLPQCLSDTLTGNLSTKGPGLMNDILDPFNTAIGEVNSLTSVASGYLNDALNSFTSSTNNMIHEANHMLSSMMTSTIDPTDKALFVQLDKLYEYLQSTDYITDYKDWRDITKCIKANCKPIAETIMDDDFMWYDKDKKEFIMPIDTGDGRIRIQKFFRNLTKEQSRKCSEIEKRYYKYLRDKKTMAKMAAEKLRVQGIKESKNPFSSIVSSLSSSRNNIVNNLF